MNEFVFVFLKLIKLNTNEWYKKPDPRQICGPPAKTMMTVRDCQ